MAKLLFLSGSARTASLNKKLAQMAAQKAEAAGAEATYVDLRDYDMPIYDGDFEEMNGLPENAIKLKALFAEQDGFFISSPEYNSSFPPLVKNVIDWMSRPHEKDEPPLIAFQGKVAALGAVSPGGLGGLRGLVSLRMLLGNIGVHVIPSQIAVGSGFSAFGEDGNITDERTSGFLDGVINEFVTTSDKLSG